MIRKLCANCKENLCRMLGKNKKGERQYGSVCWSCSMRKYYGTASHKNKIYITIERKKCEKCGFIPINICQMDIDHIDGNHKNNKIENLQVLCSNCHRLKTHETRQHNNINYR